MSVIDSPQNIDRSTEGIIKSWFDYDPNTGQITWKESVSPEWYKHKGSHTTFMCNRAGKRVKFSKNQSGHLYVSAGGKKSIYAHHIVWVLICGKMPTHHIDHVDGDPTNNCIENLRDVPHKINHRNQKMRATNSSGFTGVYWSKVGKKWCSRVMVDGKSHNLGSYSEIQDAVNARREFLDNNKHLGFTERHGFSEE